MRSVVNCLKDLFMSRRDCYKHYKPDVYSEGIVGASPVWAFETGGVLGKRVISFRVGQRR